MDWKLLTGLWKSAKNTVIVLLPAMGAGYGAFVMNVPVEYQPYFMALGGFFAYLVKNYITVKRE